MNTKDNKSIVKNTRSQRRTLAIRISFYVETNENIENENDITVKLDNIDCIYNNRTFTITTKIINTKILRNRDATATHIRCITLEIKVKGKIDIITDDIIKKIEINKADIAIYYKNKIIKWQPATIEEYYWYKLSR